jgi:hypothetical protein
MSYTFWNGSIISHGLSAFGKLIDVYLLRRKRIQTNIIYPISKPERGLQASNFSSFKERKFYL